MSIESAILTAAGAVLVIGIISALAMAWRWIIKGE